MSKLSNVFAMVLIAFTCSCARAGIVTWNFTGHLTNVSGAAAGQLNGLGVANGTTFQGTFSYNDDASDIDANANQGSYLSNFGANRLSVSSTFSLGGTSGITYNTGSSPAVSPPQDQMLIWNFGNTDRFRLFRSGHNLVSGASPFTTSSMDILLQTNSNPVNHADDLIGHNLANFFSTPPSDLNSFQMQGTNASNQAFQFQGVLDSISPASAPEPASMGAIGIGGIAIVGLIRRRLAKREKKPAA